MRTLSCSPANRESRGLDVASQNINKRLPSFIDAQLSLTLRQAGGNFQAHAKVPSSPLCCRGWGAKGGLSWCDPVAMLIQGAVNLNWKKMTFSVVLQQSAPSDSWNSRILLIRPTAALSCRLEAASCQQLHPVTWPVQKWPQASKQLCKRPWKEDQKSARYARAAVSRTWPLAHRCCTLAWEWRHEAWSPADSGWRRWPADEMCWSGDGTISSSLSPSALLLPPSAMCLCNYRCSCWSRLKFRPLANKEQSSSPSEPTHVCLKRIFKQCLFLSYD